MAVVLFLSVILIRSFLTGVIGVVPLSAHSAARFLGACGNTKAMLAYPTRQGSGLSFGGFFSADRGENVGICCAASKVMPRRFYG